MSRPSFRLGLIADCQYADSDPLVLTVDSDSGAEPPVTRRFYRRSLDKLENAIAAFNQRGVQAIVNLGDLVDRSLEDVRPVMEILDRAHAPVWSIAGNHDFADGDVAASTVFNALRMPSAYYARSVSEYRMLFLDTNELSGIKHPVRTIEHRDGETFVRKLRTAGRPNAFSWNGGVGPQQLDWLRIQIADAHRQGQQVVLFTHNPFFPAEHSHNMLNDTEFRETIRGFSNVVLSISGHNHHGNFAAFEGIQCLTLHGMVEHESNSFSIAHFYPGRVEIEGFGREPSRSILLRN